MLALEIKELAKSFGGVRAVAGVSFGMDAGERLVMIGPNGAGKTTLLNLINGQLKASRGRIVFFGRDITFLPTHRRAHLGMARAFQIISLLGEMSIWENTMLTLHGTRPSRFHLQHSLESYPELAEKGRQVLETLGLWERREEPLKNIAYGQQRRLEISLALTLEPRLLLLDEPSAGLTKEECRVVVEVLKNLEQEQSLLIVDHDMELVFEVATRIMVLHQGRVLADGSPSDIQADQRVREIYMGIEE